MHKLITPIIALVLSAGVAACGSSGSGNATAAGTTPSAGSGATATASNSAGASTAQSTSAGTSQQQLSVQAEQILQRLSNITTQVAAGQTSLAQARPQLRQVRSQSMLLVKNAKHLAASSPMRAMIVAIGNQASAYAGRLDTSQLTTAGRQALRKSSAALENLEKQVRGAVSQGKTPSLNQITRDLQALNRQANGA